jgi:hypothetical protein
MSNDGDEPMTGTSSAAELPFYMRFARPFELFHEYEGDDPFVRAEHNVIYAGPSPSSVAAG